jgi:hypothetical protein
MPIVITPTTAGVLELTVSGKLHHEDYVHFVPVLETELAETGKLRLLVLMHAFEGWDPHALWDDIKFDAKHFRDIDRLALVGETTWQQGMASFCKPFTTAEIRFFNPSHLGEARAWLTDGHPVTRDTPGANARGKLPRLS